MFEAVIAGPQRRAPRRSMARRLAPWALAIALHLVMLVMALRAQPSLETWSARMAAQIHGALAERAPTRIELEPPPAPEPAPAPEPEAAAEPAPDPAPAVEPPPAPRATPAPPQAPRAAPPAAAGAVLASKDAVADFSDQAFVVGTATAYAGGVTTATGTGAASGTAPAVQAPAAPGSPPPTARARPVRLAGTAWRCPWPTGAFDADIYEQAVVIRVEVGADGRARRVRLLDDPGLGFGDAARACALKTRFSPALDGAGDPVAATSPPIRVRFTR